MWCSRQLIQKAYTGLVLLRAGNTLPVTGIWFIIWTIPRLQEVLADSDSGNEEMSWEFRSWEDLYHIHDIYINKWFMLLQGPLLKILCLQNCGQRNKKILFPKIHWCGFTWYSNVITRTLNSMKVFSLFHGWLSSWEQRIYCEKSKQLYAIWGKHYLSNGSWALEPYCQ